MARYDRLGIDEFNPVPQMGPTGASAPVVKPVPDPTAKLEKNISAMQGGGFDPQTGLAPIGEAAEAPSSAGLSNIEPLESYQPTFHDIGHQQQTAAPQWQQEMMFPDQPPQQNLVAEMGYIPSQTPDYTGRDARLLGADMDVIPPGQTPNMVGMDPREMQANAPEIRQDASGNYVEIANPYGQGSSQPTGFTSNRPDLVGDTPTFGTGGVLPDNYVEPTAPETAVSTPPSDDKYWDEFRDAVNRLNDPRGGDVGVIEPLPEVMGTGFAAPVQPQGQAPGQQAAPLASLNQDASGFGMPQQTHPGDLGGLPLDPGQVNQGTTIEPLSPREMTIGEQAPGSLSTATGKVLTDNVKSLSASANPLDKTLASTLSGVLEQGSDIDVQSLMPRLKTEREKLSQIRESAQRRLLSDLARRGFQLGGSQEAAVLAELEREITTATAQSFRDIVNDERTRADQRLVQGMQTAASLVGQREQMGLDREQLEAQKRIAAGQEAVAVGQLGLDRQTQQQQAATQLQELDLREQLGQGELEARRQATAVDEFIGRGQLGVAAYQVGTQQYTAETQRITAENDVLLRNLAENNKFQQFLIEAGMTLAHWEAQLQESAEGRPDALLRTLTDFQGTIQPGGPTGFNL